MAAVCALAGSLSGLPQVVRAHGGDGMALEARIHSGGLDVITYVGQRPMQRELRNQLTMPLSALSRAQLLPKVTERVVMRTQARTVQEACQRGPLLRMEPDLDGQALRLLHRYRCRGALAPGLRVKFDPLPEQRARMFVYGAFYARGMSYVHTFVGREAELDASHFTQPAGAGETAHFDALFPPPEPEPPVASSARWLLWSLSAALGLAGLVWALVRARRRPADSSSYAQ